MTKPHARIKLSNVLRDSLGDPCSYIKSTISLLRISISAEDQSICVLGLASKCSICYFHPCSRLRVGCEPGPGDLDSVAALAKMTPGEIFP